MRKANCVRPKCNKPVMCDCYKPQKKECNKPCDYTCGGWSNFRPIGPQDEQIFAIALRQFCGAQFVPLMVSIQVCNGYNYIFLAEKIVTGSCEPPSLVYIKIYVSHCGQVKLVSILDAYLCPEVENDCCQNYQQYSCDCWGQQY